MPPPRSVSHNNFQYSSSGRTSPPRHRRPSNDEYRGKETEPRRRVAGGVRGAAVRGGGGDGKRDSVRFDLERNRHHVAAPIPEADSDDVATGRRTDDFGSEFDESGGRRIPKSRSSYFSGGNTVSVKEATRAAVGDEASSRGRQGMMPKSRSLHDMRNQSSTSLNVSRDSDSDVAASLTAFDPAEVKRNKEFLRAVKSGKLQKCSDLLAADWARAAAAGHADHQVSVSEVIARSGKSSKIANARDPSTGDVALHYACEGHNYELVTRLLGHGARVNVKGAHGDVPLHRAVRDRRNASMVRSLFKHDCEPDMPNENGTTPMHIAAERGHLEIMEALVDNGASVNIQDNDGNTPLHVATKQQKSKATALLLSMGCDPSIRNKAGLTPFQLSKKGKVRIAYSAFGIDN